MISDPENPAGQPQQINNGLMDLVLLVNLGGIGKAFEDSQPRSGVPNVTGSLGFPSLTAVTGPVKMWQRLASALNQPTSGDVGRRRPAADSWTHICLRNNSNALRGGQDALS